MVRRSLIRLLNATSKDSPKAVKPSSSTTVKQPSTAVVAAGSDATTHNFLNSSNEFGGNDPGVNSTISISNLDANPPVYISLYHHTNPKLFQPRKPGSIPYLLHHVISSCRSLVSLFSSQENRDRFLLLTNAINGDGNSNGNEENSESYNDSVINTNVLGQSDMGALKVMTLFQELNSALYDEHAYSPNVFIGSMVDIREFLSGCGFALEHFHRAQFELLRSESVRNWAIDCADDHSTKETNKDNKISTIAGGQSKKEWRVFDIAEFSKSNPDSVGSYLMAMTTPICWKFIDEAAVMTSLNELARKELLGEECNDSARDGQDKIKVMHVALLSFRVEDVEQSQEYDIKEQKSFNETSNAVQSRENGPSEPLEDDSLSPPHHASSIFKEETAAQLVAQLEVLYDLEHTATTADGKTETRTSVMVATFEACLRNDPNGDELRWRLASYRPAAEFGYGISL